MSVELIQVDELEGTPVSLLHEQVERVQEENWRLETELEEAYNILDEIVQAEDTDELELSIARAKTFLAAQGRD